MAWRTRFEKLAADHGNVLSEAFLKQLALATRVSGVDFQQAMFDRILPVPITNLAIAPASP